MQYAIRQPVSGEERNAGSDPVDRPRGERLTHPSTWTRTAPTQRRKEKKKKKKSDTSLHSVAPTRPSTPHNNFEENKTTTRVYLITYCSYDVTTVVSSSEEEGEPRIHARREGPLMRRRPGFCRSIVHSRSWYSSRTRSRTVGRRTGTPSTLLFPRPVTMATSPRDRDVKNSRSSELRRKSSNKARTIVRATGAETPWRSSSLADSFGK
mmetsp:Transcript_5070/g.16597  ORF Transcript_5070/g.16597 Transcript_5070/m.16597 type:complete len:209 (+) Transcript_5070:737-1363(+)